ncbi:hypothetical protein JTE90_011329 [Oedothorax gibbosus]|uniref:Methyltransferase-like protein 4 n=1 Tax=Oedothorax gibbosus TaxID=931172 RepID=A0AAV6VL07_9ARAC|nr:hypothetical protein JTE90_011329 [Oedothorax gibbosus]
MDSSAARKCTNIYSDRSKKRQHKRWKKNQILKQMTSDHELHIEKIIGEKSTSIIEEARLSYHLDSQDISSTEWFENNCKAREATKHVTNIGTDSLLSFHNEKSLPRLFKFAEEEYLLPPHSTFHLCDIKHIEILKGKKFDLIVLDPPWENKSVRRNKKYSTLSCESLLDLPIEDLCSPGCLIVLWVTNNEAQMNFITKVLFNKWKVSNFTGWHWLKVTQKGRVIHPIDWHHKKPYENLLLIRIPFNDNQSSSTSFLEPEPHKIIVSVPSSIHSHKPPLDEILKPYISENPNCLELFARYLLPGWTSLGNEVLKLQNTRLFERQTSNDDV